MLWWYAAYMVGSVAAVAWYYAGLSTAEPDQRCADHDFWCGGDDIWVLKLAAIVGLIVLALSLILSWAWLRLTVSWVLTRRARRHTHRRRRSDPVHAAGLRPPAAR